MLNQLRQGRYASLFLIFAMLFFAIQPTVNAAIVSTTDLVAEQQSQIDREYLLNSLDREEVKIAVVSQGVDVEMAKVRVASMTDSEVNLLNAKMDAMPAASGLVDTVVFVLVVLLVTDLLGVTDVYPFIR